MDAKPKSSWWKRLFQNLALFFGVFLFCGVVTEIVLRIAGYGDLEIYQPDKKLYWRLKPDQDCFTKVDHKPVHINSHGTRGAEFATEKPAGTLRILSLGDSRTFGWGLSDSETYSSELERMLRAQTGTTSNVEVINSGVNAWSFQQMLVFYRDFAAAWKPDVVLIGEANLWTQFSESNSPKFVEQFMWRVRLKNFLRHFALYHYIVEVKLSDFYSRYRTKFIPVDPKTDTLFKGQQQADPNDIFRQAVATICTVAQTNGARPILLFIPRLDELESTNVSDVLKLKRSIASDLNIPLVDMTLALKPQGKTLYLDSDPVHLNTTGNLIIAERLFETVTNLPAK